MRKPLYIYGSSNYYHGVEADLPSLKEILFAACGKKIRRIDRLTQLALIGCLQCSSAEKLAEDTGLYMSSIYGALDNSTRVLTEIYQHGRVPKPLNFINSVSNAACFYLSEQLGLKSVNQFFTREYFTLEAGLKLASLDLELGNISSALVGVVCEVGGDLEVHRQRFNIAPEYALAEGSHWLYVAHHKDNVQPIARITDIIEPVNIEFILEFLEAQASASGGRLTLGFSANVGQETQMELTRQFNAKQESFIPASLMHEFSGALQLCGYLEAAKRDVKAARPPERFIYLDRDGGQRWSLVALELC